MSQSGEKHAHDFNLILCILMAHRATYFLSVIYGDPVANYCWFQSHVLWLHLFIISIYFTFDLDNLLFHIHYSLSKMKWIEMYITFCWPFNSLKYLLIGNIFNKKYLREDNEMHSKERSVFTLTNFYECDIGKQLSFFSKLSIADLGPDKYELITETGSHFSKKHLSHHT